MRHRQLVTLVLVPALLLLQVLRTSGSALPAGEGSGLEHVTDLPEEMTLLEHAASQSSDAESEEQDQVFPTEDLLEVENEEIPQQTEAPDFSKQPDPVAVLPVRLAVEVVEAEEVGPAKGDGEATAEGSGNDAEDVLQLKQPGERVENAEEDDTTEAEQTLAQSAEDVDEDSNGAEPEFSLTEEGIEEPFLEEEDTEEAEEAVVEEAIEEVDPTPEEETGNEVPLPSIERQPVVEPIIIAEKAPCLGCVTQIRHDSADLRRVASMAAKLLEEDLQSKHTFRVTEVYRASKQVVNGIKYFLTMEVAATSCERPVPAFTLCYVAEDARRDIYAVELLHQPHRANTELLNYRQVSPSEVAPFRGLFAAATVAPPTENAATSPPSRGSSSSGIEPGDSLLDILMGLDNVMNKKKEHAAAAAAAAEVMEPPPVEEQALRRHSASPEALHVQSLLQDVSWSPADAAVEHVIGNGIADVGLLSGAAPGWDGGDPSQQQQQQKQEEQQAQEEELTSGCRSGRQFNGIEVPVNVAHPKVQEILEKFLENQEQSRSNRLVITDLTSATKQTYAETVYSFAFVLGETRCPKNSTAKRYSCSAVGNLPFSSCKIHARERPGRPIAFNSVSCSTQWQPSCPNGRCGPDAQHVVHPYGPAYLSYPEVSEDINTRDSAFSQLLRHVENEVNRRSRRPTLKKFVRTINATKTTYNLQETTDVVEQELYALTLRFVDTSCARSGPPSCVNQEDSYGPDSPTTICDVRVSSLSWADRMRVLDMFCETEYREEKQQRKRETELGGRGWRRGGWKRRRANRGEGNEGEIE